jgi:hypothetical protein
MLRFGLVPPALRHVGLAEIRPKQSGLSQVLRHYQASATEDHVQWCSNGDNQIAPALCKVAAVIENGASPKNTNPMKIN